MDHPQEVDSTQGNGTVVHNQSSNPALAAKWQALLIEYANVFEQPEKPLSQLVDHCIDLIDPNSIPPQPQLYRMSKDELKKIKDTIENYLAHGWIRPSIGSYSAPVIVIRKMTGESRIIIDYWLLNKQSRLDSYPIPHIDKLLDRLTCAKQFNKIDLAFGYHQIQMADGHKNKAAFLTRYGTYEWLVLPLRLKNAPTTFQRLMNGIFHYFLDKTLLFYLADMLVYSNMDVQHLEDVKHILQHLYDNILKAIKNKCNVNAQQVEYFGHIASNGTVVMDPSKYQ